MDIAQSIGMTKTDILEQVDEELLQNQDLHDVIDKIATGDSLENLTKTNEETTVIESGGGIPQNTRSKSTGTYKRVGKRAKKKTRIKEEKKVTKRKVMEDEEKENNEEQFNKDLITGQSVSDEEADAADTNLEHIPSKLSVYYNLILREGGRVLNFRRACAI